MKTYVDCYPCLCRNAVNIARKMTGDESLREAIVAEAMERIAHCGAATPPEVARWIIDIALRRTGENCPDPYRDEKEKATALAWRVVESLDRMKGYDPSSFESRLRLAVAGNVLDFCVFGELDPEAALRAVESAMTKPVDVASVERLRRAMDRAGTILYLLDNSGEAVFDRVFLEPYREKTVLAYRERPAFNDVTARELEESGLKNFARGVIGNGNGIPGTVPESSGAEFRRIFREADVVISKGQGNFETLNGMDRSIVFLFLAKCPVVIREIQAEPQSLQVILHRFRDPA